MACLRCAVPLKPWALCWTFTLSQRRSETAPLLAGPALSAPQTGKYCYSNYSLGSEAGLDHSKTAGTTQPRSRIAFPSNSRPHPHPPTGNAVWLKAVKASRSFTRGLARSIPDAGGGGGGGRRKGGGIRTDLASHPARYQEPAPHPAPLPGPALRTLSNKHFHFLSALSSPAAGRRAEPGAPPPGAPIGQGLSPCLSASVRGL